MSEAITPGEQIIGAVNQDLPASSLRVPLTDLRRRLNKRRVVEMSTHVDGVRVRDTEVASTAPVEVAVTLEAVSDGVTVTGRIEATWRGPCHLCLVEVEGPLLADVNELYADRSGDDEVYLLHAEYVDLEPLVSDALRLELPLITQCPNGGVGVCAIAPEILTSSGNAQSQQQPVADPRWAALDTMTFKDD